MDREGHATPLGGTLLSFERIPVDQRQCWEVGAFTTNYNHDPGCTHILIPDEEGDNVIDINSNAPEALRVVSIAWLLKCFSTRDYVDETNFIHTKTKILNRTDIPTKSAIRKSLTTTSLTYTRSDPQAIAPQLQSKAKITYRRSDVSSMPLRPDGVFKDRSFSIFGQNDQRLESSLAHQITSNGGTVVDFATAGQCACICADGTRPTRDVNVPLVSQRWLNECLAHGEVINPNAKIIFTPSMSQLPLLVVKKICLYVSEKDPDKFEEIVQVAKLCGIRFVSRNDTRTPLSAVTHFIFYDCASANRRRDLLPLAQRTNKFVISYDWLKDTFLSGQIRDEVSYDITSSLGAPALCNTVRDENQIPKALVLSSKTVIIDSSVSEQVTQVLSQLGANYEIYSAREHWCNGQYRLSTVPCVTECSCQTVTDRWLSECAKQKRFISPTNFQDTSGCQVPVDSPKDSPSTTVGWENSKASDIANNILSGN